MKIHYSSVHTIYLENKAINEFDIEVKAYGINPVRYMAYIMIPGVSMSAMGNTIEEAINNAVEYLRKLA